MKSWERLCLVAARSEGLLIDFILVFLVRWGVHALGVDYLNFEPVLECGGPPFSPQDLIDYPGATVFYGSMFFASGLPELYTTLIWFAYGFLSLSIFGQTLGMRQAGVKLVNLKGGKAGVARTFVRQLVFPLSAICWLGYAVAGFAPDAAALHDLVSRTRVVYSQEPDLDA